MSERILKYTVFIFLMVILSSCLISKKSLVNESKYLVDGMIMIEDFKRLYPVVAIDNFKVKHNRNKFNNSYIKKYKSISWRSIYGPNKYNITYSIRPYLFLDDHEKYFLSQLANAHSEIKNGEELYYNLMIHWYMTHPLCHHLCDQLLERQNNTDVFNEMAIDITNLAFMVQSGNSKKFGDFKKLMQDINNKTCKKLGLKKDTPRNLYHTRLESDFDMIHSLFYSSTKALMVIDRIYKEIE